jgi:NAD(P)-dependent dehydrogenase (short-subunit alcohol dehydrogenase family)
MVMHQHMVALVTGASRGLGLEVARLLAHRGARLILTARGGEALERAADGLAAPTALIMLPGDIADPQHAERLVALGVARFGRIDLLVNNASTLGPTPMPRLEALPLDALDRVIRVNVSAPLHLLQLVLPQMRARREGTIVNVTSDAAVQAYPGWGGYGVSKAGLEHLSRVLAAEIAGSGIRIYVVDPGEMNTQMYRDASPGADVSALPGPESAAARLVDLLDHETEPFGRFELQAWKVRGPEPKVAGVGRK